MRTLPLFIMSALTLASCSTGSQQPVYPAAPADSTVYTVNGVTVVDTYRPLENDTSAETKAWVEAENKVTQDYLAAIPFRGDIHKRLEALNRYERRGMPSKEDDGRYYFYANDGSQNQSVLYRMDSLTAEPTVFLDPNTLSDDGTVALTGVFMSPDGKYTAYTISRSGSDWTEIYLLDTETGALLDDHIVWAKFTGVSWDGNGFYYSAYDAPEAGKEFSNANTGHKIYYHTIGTPQSSDRLAYADDAHPLHFHTAQTSHDGGMLAVYTGGEGSGDGVMVKNLRKPGAGWTVIEPSQDYNNSIIDMVDGNIYMLTSADAPRNRFVVINPTQPDRKNWRELIPEDPDGGVLTSVQFAGPDRFIAVYDRDAANHAYLYNLDGKRLAEIQLPTYGNVSFSSSRDSDEVFYTFSSFVYPSAIYTYDVASNESKLYHATILEGFNPDDYITEQVFYTSADGTNVPMFTVRHKDVKPDGTNPVYLYGYGGFNVTLNPSFSPYRLLWLENGGIYAQANLRGGAEYGDEWHKAGTKMQKLNVFNDFIAAGEYMIDQGWTTPDLLTIEGGSNGGLLVGAVTNMRPDLFKVAIPRVGVMDMMRYHLFTIGWNWAADYGTADDSPEMAEYLHAYSPIHNISNDGTPYPAIMVTTADHDDRVVPAHSFKYAATLQAANTGDAPKLIRIDSKAGHGAGKPLSKVIDEYTDIYSFIYHNLGRTPDTKK
ncbi:MAG: prolyl oligopeptidase family serine peptidase [Muribaculaceae bacterium]|nr:prolyl oligopeptidase family serine peptidase [Muribaculaceae bacterium]